MTEPATGSQGVYPVIFIDTIVVKICDGQVANPPVYAAVGVTGDDADVRYATRTHHRTSRSGSPHPSAIGNLVARRCRFSNAEIARRRLVREKAVETTIGRIAKHLGLEPDAARNHRVHLARVYLRMLGAKDAHEPSTP